MYSAQKSEPTGLKNCRIQAVLYFLSDSPVLYYHLFVNQGTEPDMQKQKLLYIPLIIGILSGGLWQLLFYHASFPVLPGLLYYVLPLLGFALLYRYCLQDAARSSRTRQFIAGISVMLAMDVMIALELYRILFPELLHVSLFVFAGSLICWMCLEQRRIGFMHNCY